MISRLTYRRVVLVLEMKTSYLIMHDYITENLHISVTKWCILWYLFDALWGLLDLSFGDPGSDFYVLSQNIWVRSRQMRDFSRCICSVISHLGEALRMWSDLTYRIICNVYSHIEPLLTHWSYVFLALTHRYVDTVVTWTETIYRNGPLRW